jgi:hypothetical protein
MCGCLFLLFGSLAPRFTLALVALFGNSISRAFDGNNTEAFLGWLFLPFTELLYVFMFWMDGSVTGFDWFFVALGFLFDLGSYTSGGVQARDRIQTNG